MLTCAQAVTGRWPLDLEDEAGAVIRGKKMGNDRGDAALAFSGVGLKDEDIFEAMRTIPGYIDITPGDFKELYCMAYRHAMERFARSMLARDIMEERVVTVSPEASLVEIAELIGKHGISGLPVVDEAMKVLGVVSEKDILSQLGFKDKLNFMTIVSRCLRAGGCLTLPARSSTAREIMTSPAVTVLADTPLLEVVKVLSERGINRLPVTDSEGHLLGILARSDIVSANLRSGTCSWNI